VAMPKLNARMWLLNPFKRKGRPLSPGTDSHFVVPGNVPQELVSIGEELSRIEENARWSSQAQFEQGKYWRGCNLAIGIPAGILGVASGGRLNLPVRKILQVIEASERHFAYMAIPHVLAKRCRRRNDAPVDEQRAFLWSVDSTFCSN